MTLRNVTKQYTGFLHCLKVEDFSLTFWKPKWYKRVTQLPIVYRETTIII